MSARNVDLTKAVAQSFLEVTAPDQVGYRYLDPDWLKSVDFSAPNTIAPPTPNYKGPRAQYRRNRFRKRQEAIIQRNRERALALQQPAEPPNLYPNANSGMFIDPELARETRELERRMAEIQRELAELEEEESQQNASPPRKESRENRRNHRENELSHRTRDITRREREVTGRLQRLDSEISYNRRRHEASPVRRDRSRDRHAATNRSRDDRRDRDRHHDRYKRRSPVRSERRRDSGQGLMPPGYVPKNRNSTRNGSSRHSDDRTERRTDRHHSDRKREGSSKTSSSTTDSKAKKPRLDPNAEDIVTISDSDEEQKPSTSRYIPGNDDDDDFPIVGEDPLDLVESVSDGEEESTNVIEELPKIEVESCEPAPISVTPSPVSQSDRKDEVLSSNEYQDEELLNINSPATESMLMASNFEETDADVEDQVYDCLEVMVQQLEHEIGQMELLDGVSTEANAPIALIEEDLDDEVDLEESLIQLDTISDEEES